MSNHAASVLYEKIGTWAFGFRRLLRSRFGTNLLSVSSGQILSRLISLITIGYVARTVGPENYGLLGFGTSVAAYAGILISPGLLTWGTRAVARDHARAGTYLVIINLTQLLLACAAYIALAAFSILVLDGSERTIVLLCGLSLFATALNVDWVYYGLERMSITAFAGVATSAIMVVGLLTLIRLPEHVYRDPLLRFGLPLIATCFLYYVLVRKWGFRPSMPRAREFRDTIIASIPLSLTVALVTVLHFSNALVVRLFVGTAALGMFWAAFGLFKLPLMSAGILQSVFLPRLSNRVVDEGRTAQREAALFAKGMMGLAFLIAPIMFMEAPEIVHIILGAKYRDAIPLLQVMSAGVIFNFAICGYTNCLIPFRRDKVMLLVVSVAAIVSVGGGFLLVPKFGVLGAAIVVACIDLGGWLVSLPFYRRTIGSLQFQAWVAPVLGAGGVLVASSFLQRASVPVGLRLPMCILLYVLVVMPSVRGVFR